MLFYAILGNIVRQCSAHGVAHRKYKTSQQNQVKNLRKFMLGGGENKKSLPFQMIPRKLEYKFRETNSTQTSATNIPETTSIPIAASEGFTIAPKKNAEGVQTIPITTSEDPTIATQTIVEGNQKIPITVLEGLTIVTEKNITQNDENKSLREMIKTNRAATKIEKSSKESKKSKDTKYPKKPKKIKNSVKGESTLDTKYPKKPKKIKNSVKGESTLGNIVNSKKPKSSKAKITKTESSKDIHKSKKTLGKIQSKSKAAKSKSKKSYDWCPFRSNSSERMLNIIFKKKSKLTFKSKSSKGESKKDLSNNFGQKPGSAITLTSVSDPNSCIKPVEVSDGAHLTLQPCTYDYPNDTFVIDRFGRLHTSNWSLCVISIDLALVLGSCDSCSAVFGYDEETMMIFLFQEKTKVVTMENSKIFLTDKYDDEKTSRQLQTWYVMVIGAPTSSPAPTAAPFSLGKL